MECFSGEVAFKGIKEFRWHQSPGRGEKVPSLTEWDRQTRRVWENLMGDREGFKSLNFASQQASIPAYHMRALWWCSTLGIRAVVPPFLYSWLGF